MCENDFHISFTDIMTSKVLHLLHVRGVKSPPKCEDFYGLTVHRMHLLVIGNA